MTEVIGGTKGCFGTATIRDVLEQKGMKSEYDSVLFEKVG